MDYKKYLIPILTLVFGVAIGKFSTPEKVVTKIETKVVEKEVVKYKEKTSINEKKNQEITKTETISPDGTVKREEKIVDKGTMESTTDKELKKINEKSEQHLSETKTIGRSMLGVSLMFSPAKSEFQSLPVVGKNTVGLLIDKQILGPISFGVWYLSNNTYGFTLGGKF